MDRRQHEGRLEAHLSVRGGVITPRFRLAIAACACLSLAGTGCERDPPPAKPEARTQTALTYVGGAKCADCHADPHRGQFERLGRTDCARCHKSTTQFGTLSFRHNLDSRFQLGDQHAKVPCASCHKAEKVEGVEVVRYKPLPTECVSCHGREEGGAPFRRRRG